MIELEIDEAAFAEEEARLSLRQLAALGVRLALDEFGTGDASLNYLRQYPVRRDQDRSLSSCRECRRASRRRRC